MDGETWSTLINAIIYLLMIVVPGALAWIYKSFRYVKETGDLLTVVGEAISDGNVTVEEIAAIVKEFNDLKSVEKAIKETSANKVKPLTK